MTRSGVCFCLIVTRCSQKSRLFRKPPLDGPASSPAAATIPGSGVTGKVGLADAEAGGDGAFDGLRCEDGLWNDVRRSHKSLALLKVFPSWSSTLAKAAAAACAGSCM